MLICGRPAGHAGADPGRRFGRSPGSRREPPSKARRRPAKEKSRCEPQGLSGERLDEAWPPRSAAARDRPHLQRPFLSANDRSRWDTVRAWSKPDMRVPACPYAIDRVIEQPSWDTIDMVKHDGHFYSSKPPLFATLIAGRLLADLPPHRRHAGHASLRDRPLPAGRCSTWCRW